MQCEALESSLDLAAPETFRVPQDVSAMMSAGCIYVSIVLQLRTLLWASTIGLLHWAFSKSSADLVQ